MKVMLITPPYHSGVVESAGVWMPVAFVYLAGSLREAGHEVVIYDAMSYFHDHERIRAEIRSVKPDMVALTAITASVIACKEVCESAKQINPEIVTVIGNAHATFLWKEMLNEYDAVDIVARGEGERTVCELADALQNGTPLEDVRGLAFRKDGKPFVTGARPNIQDLDSLPMAFDLIDWPIYTYRPKANSTLAVVSSSRGCMEACSFCSQQLFWKRTWRGRSPENFVDELEYLNKTFGVDIAMLADETPTVDRDRWEAILDLLIARDVGVELLMETRVDDIIRDEDIMHKYRAAGFSHIYVGVEATEQETLDLYNKNISVDQSRKAIALINKHEMVSETSFVLGLPNETPEHIAATVKLAMHYNPDMAFFLAIAPWPYTRLAHDVKEHISDLDYSHYNLVEAVVKPEQMTLEEMNKALGKASHEFFANKFQNLDGMPRHKRHFMVKVANILMNHSYLGEDLQTMRKTMPDWVRKMLDAIEAEEAGEGAAK